MSRLSLSSLRSLAAVDQRSRIYATVFAIAIRFELDDTKAANDAKHFQDILKCFGFPAAEEYVISGSDKTPGWSIDAKFKKILKFAIHASSSGRALVMVHYAGHSKRVYMKSSLS
jgi:hypothetical protein